MSSNIISEPTFVDNNDFLKNYHILKKNNITLSEIDGLSKDSFETNVTNEIFRLEKNSISNPIKIDDA